MRDPIGTWKPANPATAEALAGAQEALAELPEGYLEFLAYSNGGEGDVPFIQDWVQLWPAEQLPELNAAYEVSEFLPGYIAIGSNGGDMMLALDVRSGQSTPVCTVPFIGMAETEVEVIAPSLGGFLGALSSRSRSA